MDLGTSGVESVLGEDLEASLAAFLQATAAGAQSPWIKASVVVSLRARRLSTGCPRCAHVVGSISAGRRQGVQKGQLWNGLTLREDSLAATLGFRLWRNTTLEMRRSAGSLRNGKNFSSQPEAEKSSPGYVGDTNSFTEVEASIKLSNCRKYCPRDRVISLELSELGPHLPG